MLYYQEIKNRSQYFNNWKNDPLRKSTRDAIDIKDPKIYSQFSVSAKNVHSRTLWYSWAGLNETIGARGNLLPSMLF